MKKSTFKSVALRWLCLILILIVLAFTCFLKIKPLIFTYAKSVAETTMLNALNKAVNDILSQNTQVYNDIARLYYDDNGNVKSLQMDATAANLFKSRIANKIADIIGQDTRYKIGIPLGTLTGNEYLMGLGPDIIFNMQLTETARVDFKHEFCDAGINQVLHRVVANINITVNIIMLGYSKGFTVSTSAIVAETVIVGVVPDSFTNVIEHPNDDIADEIFNYADID